MNGIVVAVVLTALVLAGCYGSTNEVDPEPQGVTGLLALEAMRDWVANATTLDPAAGLRWVDGRWQGPNNTTVYASQGRLYVASNPFATHLDTIDGSADWDEVRQMLSVNEPLVHPDYTSLALHAIRGNYFPAWYEDRGADGVARSWQSGWQVEWDEGQQDEWRVGWNAHGSGSAVSWGIQGFTQGREGVCSDQAGGSPLLDSTQALATALMQEPFAEVRQAYPDGELWMTLTLQQTPRWEYGQDGVRYVCPDPMDPTWRIRWMDLNATVAGGAPYVDVLVDARDGDTADVHQAFLRPPGDYVWTTLLEEADPMPGHPVTASWAFDVPDHQVRLVVDVRPEPPAVPGVQVDDENDYRLVAPDGSSYVLSRSVSAWGADIVHPAEGTWTLERTPVDGADSTHALRTVSVRVVG